MLKLMPWPNFIKVNKEKVSFSNYQIIIENKYEQAVNIFNVELSKALNINENAYIYSFEFLFNKELKEEEYIIAVDNDVTHVEAGSEKAFFYASRTLSQLLDLYSKKKDVITINTCYIEDKPRFAYRGFLLDEVRHFFGKEEVKKYIDVLSYLKINFFHWHLSDDQGFRIDFKTFPKLKEIASCRSKTKLQCMENDVFDNTPYCYCYSYSDIKEIIKYAKERYVSIIPEIDMPGHTSAIVAAYPMLHCFNKQNEVRGDFGVFKEIICPGKEVSYEFCKKLLGELMNLFKDSKYIHLGGDEVNRENYETCPDCQRKMKELNLNSTKELQTYFSNEMAKYVLENSKNKAILWADGLFQGTNPNVIMQYWDFKMDEEKINFINEGRKTIYSPCSQFYFNDPYAELPLLTTYNRGIHLTNLKHSSYKNILGMECCIWNEWISDIKMLEFNTFPRLLAFAEASWTNPKNHDFKDFVKRNEAMKDFYKYYNIIKAPKSIYLNNNPKYKKEVSRLYRKDEKDIELKLAHIKH